MKTKLIIVLGLTAAAITAYASFISPPYDNSKRPTMALPVAYDRAVTALGADTNRFHCVSASLSAYFTTEGEWYFTFCSTNSKAMPKLIAVGFNGKVIFDNGLR